MYLPIFVLILYYSTMTFDELLDDYQALKSEHAEVVADREELKKEVEKLSHRLAWYQRQVFGRKSERQVPDPAPNQEWLFESKPAEGGAPPKNISVAGHTRKVKGAAKSDEEAPEGTFPAYLRREDKVLVQKPEGYSDDELEELDPKVTERLAETPGEHFVRRFVRRVFVVKKTGEFHTAPAPAHIFGRCKVDESFLVSMAIKKFLWHLPLYRQHQMLKLDGIQLSRSSMASWMIRLGELYLPAAYGVKSELWEQEQLHVDNSPVLVGKGGKRKGRTYGNAYFWPLLHPDVGVYFEFSRTKAYKAFEGIISGYSGTLICDAEEIFQKYATANDLNWQLCWMHIRRNFFDVATSNQKRSDEALEFIRALYRVETEIQEQHIENPEKKALYRLKHSSPILDELKSWYRQLAATPEAITDELLSKAISYLHQRWDAATLFLHDGNLPLDNGADEREVRPVKLGFKNFLHCSSELGAKAAATFYTLIGTAKMHGVHPYYYLLDLTRRIEQPGLKAEDLTPRNWKKRFYHEAVPEHLWTHPPP